MRFTDPTVDFGPFRFRRDSRELFRDGRNQEVPQRALALLDLLVERAGELVSKEEMFEAGWPGTHVTASSLTEAMSRLRGALGDDAQRPRYVETLAGRGYRFIAPVRAPAAHRRRPLLAAAAAGLLVAAALAWTGIGEPDPFETARIAELSADGDVIEELPLPRFAVRDLVPSPDGRHLAFSTGNSMDGDIWVFDRSSRVLSRLSQGGDNSEAVWTADGQWVAWASRSGRSFDLVRRRTDGSGPIETLLSAPGDQYPESWSADGRRLVYSETGAGGGLDLAVLELEDDTWRPRSLRATPHHEYLGSYSPDGSWLIFASDATGAFEIYVQDGAGASTPVRISPRGGSDPFWSADGGSLFYVRAGQVMRLRLTAPGFPGHSAPEKVRGLERVTRVRATAAGGFMAALPSQNLESAGS